jgi:hypothetical protein
MVPLSISGTISASWAGCSGSSANASRLAFTWAAMALVIPLATTMESPPAAIAPANGRVAVATPPMLETLNRGWSSEYTPW